MRRFFIVGAPKCGTTALARSLSLNPNIHITNPKEPHYYLKDASPTRKIINESHYAKICTPPRGIDLTGEASVWYLYSDIARESIKKYHPNCKIVIMLRRQDSFLPSLHSQMILNGNASVRTFEEAWQLEIKRAPTSESYREEMGDWKNRFCEVGRFSEHVRSYVTTFGAKNVLLILQENMISNMEKEIIRVLNFLEIDTDDSIHDLHTLKANERREHKSLLLKTILNGAARNNTARHIASKLKRMAGVGSLGLMDALYKANTRKISPPIVDSLVKLEIMKYFESDNRILSRIVGENLERVWNSAEGDRSID